MLDINDEYLHARGFTRTVADYAYYIRLSPQGIHYISQEGHRWRAGRASWTSPLRTSAVEAFVTAELLNWGLDDEQRAVPESGR